MSVLNPITRGMRMELPLTLRLQTDVSYKGNNCE